MPSCVALCALLATYVWRERTVTPAGPVGMLRDLIQFSYRKIFKECLLGAYSFLRYL